MLVITNELRAAAREAGWPVLLLLERHSESYRNRIKGSNIYLPDDESTALIKGIPDHRISLTDEGTREAIATGAPLRAAYGDIDVAYDTGYLRTELTRRHTLAVYSPKALAQIKLRTNHLIHERLAGYVYDMTDAEVRRHFPWFEAHWNTFGPFYTTPPGGQSQETVCNNVYRFVGIMRKHRAGKKVLVVTHGGTIRAFRFCLEKWTPDQYIENYSVDPPKNCGITAYVFDPGSKRLKLVEYNRVYWS
jgi:probable phosphoglycerate mutase